MKKSSICCIIIMIFSLVMPLVSLLYPQTAYADGGMQTVGANTIVNTAAVLIRQRAGVKADSSDLSVNVLNLPQDVTAPEGEVALTVDLPYGVRYNSPTTANVTISVNGRIAAVTTLKFEVKMYKQVLIASRTIAVREVLTADSLRYERLDIGRLNAGYYSDATAVLGLITRRMITPGTPINQYMIEKPIVIKRNNNVTIMARIGALEVTAAGQALQDGYEGKIIRVKNLNSSKILSAKVIDENTVQVLSSK